MSPWKSSEDWKYCHKSLTLWPVITTTTSLAIIFLELWPSIFYCQPFFSVKFLRWFPICLDWQCKWCSRVKNVRREVGNWEVWTKEREEINETGRRIHVQFSPSEHTFSFETSINRVMSLTEDFHSRATEFNLLRNEEKNIKHQHLSQWQMSSCPL